MPNEIKDINEGLEAISIGLGLLEPHKDYMNQLVGPIGVDICARLNAQTGSLDKLLTPMKAELKAYGITQRMNIMKGNKYEAELKTVTKTVLLTDKIKKFLGKKIAQYQTTREEVQISFHVKS